MKHALAIADTAGRAALGLIGFLNLAFLAVFLLTLAVLGGQAKADEKLVACGGQDLLAAMERDDPAKLEEIRAEAAKVVNGKGILWKIEKDGVAPSWLFGTMHLTDTRVITLPPAAQAAFDGAGTVVVEAVDALDEQKAAAAMFARPDLMMFTDGTTLSSLAKGEDLVRLKAGLEARGIPLVTINTMKPWLVSTMVALPACELARKQAHAPFLDLKLAQDAKAGGKQLLGLETMISQLEAMDSIPPEKHMRGLIDTLALGDSLEDMFETMVVLYLNGDTGMIWPLFSAVMPEAMSEGNGYTEFEQIMIRTRNHGMATNAAPVLDKGNAFIAVGALHLPGEEGLVELLRKAGYSVTPAG